MDEPARKQRTGWQVLGIVVAAVLVVGGLAAVGVFVFFAIAFANYGDNK